MQKKLIAAAVAGLLAAPVFAQSNVTISGRMAAGFDSYRIQASGYSTENRVSDQSSRIIFGGTEDLGGGLSAWFQIDSRFQTDRGGAGQPGTFGSGNTAVGLKSNRLGTFLLGRWDTYYDAFAGQIEGNRAGSLQTLAGHGIMSQLGANGYAAATMGGRVSNLMAWISPNWNGFTAVLGYTTNPAGNEGTGLANESKDGAWAGKIQYNNGPWKAGYMHLGYNKEGAASDMRARGDRAWLGYTFGMGLKLGLGWDRSGADAGTPGASMNKRNAWMIPVSYSFGPHAVYATWAHAGKTQNVAQSSASQWTLGYDYALSKRTSVGAFYTKLNNNSGAYYDMFGVATGNEGTLTAVGQDARQFYMGIAHNF